VKYVMSLSDTVDLESLLLLTNVMKHVID